MSVALPQRELALTPGLLAWLRADSAWPSLPLAWRQRAHWRARWGGLNARLSAAHGMPLVDARPPDPVLIAGPWRSGTSALHELLVAATGGVTALTWQCMNATAFALTGAPRSPSTAPRPMDGLHVGSHSPQEDEFALLTLGVDSAYRAFLMPHRIDSLHHTLDPQHWLSHPDWLAPWHQFLQGVRRTLPGAKSPLILKSPNHSFRLPAILAHHPGARVVWMARPASEVLASNRKMWRAMFATYGLTAEVDAQALDRFLAQALHRSAEMIHWCARQLPAGQFCLVSQAALRRAPVATVQAVCRQLQLPFGETQAWRTVLDRVKGLQADRYPATPLPVELTQATAQLDAAYTALGSMRQDRQAAVIHDA